MRKEISPTTAPTDQSRAPAGHQSGRLRQTSRASRRSDQAAQRPQIQRERRLRELRDSTRFTTRSSGDPEVQLWAPRAAPTFGAARDLTQGVVVDSVNVSVLP